MDFDIPPLKPNASPEEYLAAAAKALKAIGPAPAEPPMGHFSKSLTGIWLPAKELDPWSVSPWPSTYDDSCFATNAPPAKSITKEDVLKGMKKLYDMPIKYVKPIAPSSVELQIAEWNQHVLKSLYSHYAIPNSFLTREDTRAREQRILRAYGGHRCEYVWSETLKAHVRIGESLKPRKSNR